MNKNYDCFTSCKILHTNAETLYFIKLPKNCHRLWQKDIFIFVTGTIHSFKRKQAVTIKAKQTDVYTAWDIDEDKAPRLSWRLDKLWRCDGRRPSVKRKKVANKEDESSKHRGRGVGVVMAGSREDRWGREPQVMVCCRRVCDGRMGFESFNFISSASVWGL